MDKPEKKKRRHIGAGENFKPVIKGRRGNPTRVPYVVDPITGCWLSTGKTNSHGYAMVNSEGAHRIYYEAV